MMRIMGRGKTDARALSLLEGALLGLIHDEPSSGYALRKVFQDTPMFHFSDSPGSIYPALRRLEARGTLRSTVEGARTLRPRQVFRLTPAGSAALRAWLSAPVTRETVVQGLDGAMLRFAFLDRVLGPEATAGFLAALARELAAHVAALEGFHETQARALPLTGRLALESGIDGYKARLAWARRAARHFKASRIGPKGEDR
jgi:DNA-binding PadR family transcriptional regulator